MVTTAQFHKLWAELHTRAASADHSAFRPPAADPSALGGSEIDWLAHFSSRIRCPRCRRHWLALVRAHPPELTSRYTYFRWTVRAHNAINAMLGKPVITFQHACSLWNYAPSYDDV